MNIKTEDWCGHRIRFVEREPGEWWAVATDIAKALGFRDAHNATHNIPGQHKATATIDIVSAKSKAPKAQKMTVLSQHGLYRLVMRSNKPEAENFQDFVFDLLKGLRIESGLTGSQVLNMLD